MSYTLTVTEQVNSLTLSENSYTLTLSAGGVGTDPSGVSGSGSPVSVVTPSFIGQLYFDTAQWGSVYAANGLASSNWVELVRNFQNE